MMDSGSLSFVPIKERFDSGVSTWSSTSCGDQSWSILKNAMAFLRSMRFTMSLRMCSCSKPSVCPAS